MNYLEATAHYDEFLARVQRDHADVAAWIERAGDFSLEPSAQLARVDELKSWLDEFRPLPREIVDELRAFYTVALTFNSNALEGNTLSQSETELVLAHGVTVGGHSLVEHLEVIGHRDAMGYMEELADGGGLGEREIKGLHALIMRPVETATKAHGAGEYRRTDECVLGTSFRLSARERVPEDMKQFVSWLRRDGTKSLHPIVRASEAHFRFVSIHPFRDGNGRTARLLMNLLLLRAGFPIAVIPNSRRAKYLDALVEGQARGAGAAPLTEVVSWACRESLVETLRLLATAATSRGKSGNFYRALLETPN